MASLSCANSPSAYASYDVLVHQLVVLLAASFRPNLAVQPLPFASSCRLLTTRFSTVIFLQRTFTSLVHAHAGRTQIRATDRIQLRRFWHGLRPSYAKTGSTVCGGWRLALEDQI